jgi:nucleoid-associated protein YgaU
MMPILRPTAPLVLLAALGLGAAPAAAQSLRGSPSSIDRMYQQARGHDLTFYRSGTGVRGAAREGDLVRLSGNEDYRLSGVTYPYALPSARLFVQRLGAQYHDRCGERLVITSAARPTSLRLVNSAERSVHPTGMAIDIRKPRGRACLAWLRQTLLSLETQGVIEATEEHRPPHFHVAVFPTQYRRYVNNGAGGDDDDRPSSTRVARGGESSSASRSSSRSTYRVRQGDSLWEIARRNDTTVERLRAANDMRSNRIVPGQVLIIPTR